MGFTSHLRVSTVSPPALLSGTTAGAKRIARSYSMIKRTACLLFESVGSVTALSWST